MNKIFPIRLYATHQYGWAQIPELAKKIWMRLRAEKREVPVKSYFNEVRMTPADKIGWYAADCEIVSNNRVELYIYNMEDAVHGGIGERIVSVEIDVPTTEAQQDGAVDEYQLLQKHVYARKFEIAESELKRRKEIAWIREVTAVQNELFGENPSDQ